MAKTLPSRAELYRLWDIWRQAETRLKAVRSGATELRLAIEAEELSRRGFEEAMERLKDLA